MHLCRCSTFPIEAVVASLAVLAAPVIAWLHNAKAGLHLWDERIAKMPAIFVHEMHCCCTSVESLTVNLVALSNGKIQTDAPVHKIVDVACILRDTVDGLPDTGRCLRQTVQLRHFQGFPLQALSRFGSILADRLLLRIDLHVCNIWGLTAEIFQ